MHIKEDEESPAWALEIGFYPGIMLGFRSYPLSDGISHVLYVPFVNLVLTTYK
jgi:hypothetical protein